MKRMVGIAVVQLSLLWALSAQAQDASVSPEAEVRKLLASLKMKTGMVKDVSYSFTKTTQAMGQQIVNEGEVKRKFPDKVRMQSSTLTPMGSVDQTAVSDGLVLWQVTNTPNGQQIVKFDLTKLPAGKGQAAAMATGGLMEPFETGDPEKLLKRYDIQILGKEDGKRHVIEFRPKAGEGGKVGKIKRWYGVSDGFLYKAEIYTASGDLMMTQEGMAPSFDTGLSDDLFRYTPPQGAKVQDGNELMNQRMQMMKKQMEQTK